MVTFWISEHGPLVIVKIFISHPHISTAAWTAHTAVTNQDSVIMDAVELNKKHSGIDKTRFFFFYHPDAVPAYGSGQQQLSSQRHIWLGGAGVLPQCSDLDAGQPEPAERRRQAL